MKPLRSWAGRAAAVTAVAAAAVMGGMGAASAAPPSTSSAAAPGVDWAADAGAGTQSVATSRIAGANRYETAVKIANRSFPGTASTVYLARGDVFADALAAGTLTDGPVLLVPSCGTPPAAVVNKVASLNPSKVIALGGTSSVCNQTLTAAAGGRSTARIAGADRYATARAIADRRATQSPQPTTVYIASGANTSPDAVAGGVLTDGPILTVAPGASAHAASAWAENHPLTEKVIALGGTSAVSTEVLNIVAGGHFESARLSGSNRYATAATIAKHKFATAPVAYLARGDVFADAVASGSLADGPVFLTGSCSLPTEVSTALSMYRPAKVIALGGASSVCDGVLAAASSAADQHSVTAVDAAISSACAVSNGNAYCWGRDDDGFLGAGVRTSLRPVRVQGLTNVTDISVSADHTCAISGGKVFCWGNNGLGQLGDGTYNGSRTPVQVRNLSNVSAISSGDGSTCAVSSGKAYCWGTVSRASNPGAIGPNVPLLVSGLTNVTEVSAGSGTSCAVSSGRAYCWGNNEYGQLGNGTTTGSNTPIRVPGLGTVTSVGTNAANACAISDGKPYCWGMDEFPEIATRQPRLNPVRIAGVTGAAKVAVGDLHACTTSGSSSYCWGYNDTGSLGNGTGADSQSAVKVRDLAGASSLSAGVAMSCGVKGGSAYCWGFNDEGQLGNGTRTSAFVPAVVLGLP